MSICKRKHKPHLFKHLKAEQVIPVKVNSQPVLQALSLAQLHLDVEVKWSSQPVFGTFLIVTPVLD